MDDNIYKEFFETYFNADVLSAYIEGRLPVIFYNESKKYVSDSSDKKWIDRAITGR